LSASHPDSGARVAAGMPVFDALFASFGGGQLASGSSRAGSRRPKRTDRR